MSKQIKCSYWILNYLKANTGKDASIEHVTDLYNAYDDEVGSINRKTFLSVLKELRENQELLFGNSKTGVEYKCDERNNITDIRFRHAFTENELDEILSAVDMYDLIDDAESEDLCERLRSVLGYKSMTYDKDSNEFRVERLYDKKTMDLIRTNCAMIREAIQTQKMCSFRLCGYTKKGSLKPLRENFYEVYPYKIFLEKGKYYLLAGMMNKAGIKNYVFRIDLMSLMDILDEELIQNSRIPESCDAHMGFEEMSYVTFRFNSEYPKDAAKYTPIVSEFGKNWELVREIQDNDVYVTYFEAYCTDSTAVEFALKYADWVTITAPERTVHCMESRLDILTSKYRKKEDKLNERNEHVCL